MKPIHLSGALLSSALLLSACGGGGSASTTQSNTDASTTTSSSSSGTATAESVTSTSTSTSSRGSVTSAPVITTQPVSQSVTAGSSASFSVVATGADTLAYQWRKGGVAITGATSATYTMASTATTDIGSYDVVVTNSKGSATSSAVTLSVTANVNASSAVTASVVAAAQTFLSQLSSSQQTTATLSWDLNTARRWSNLPAAMVSRNGLAWGNLSSDQKAYARTLIATALGSVGNKLHADMQAADDYLYANGGGSSYGNGQYYIAFIGTPSATDFWVLQLTGHHLTFNIAFNGTYKSPTPLFLGVEPKATFTVNGSTYDVMATQRSAFSNLGAVLTSYSSAKLSGTYSDLLFGANGSGNIDGSCPRAYSTVTEHGVLYSSLSSAHQALVQEAIKSYVNTQNTEYAKDLLATYLSDSALAQTYVAYAGSGTVTAKADYFRIEGPRVWIEFSVQQGVIFRSDIHYHTIWRDKYADYGGKCV